MAGVNRGMIFKIYPEAEIICEIVRAHPGITGARIKAQYPAITGEEISHKRYDKIIRILSGALIRRSGIISEKGHRVTWVAV